MARTAPAVELAPEVCCSGWLMSLVSLLLSDSVILYPLVISSHSVILSHSIISHMSVTLFGLMLQSFHLSLEQKHSILVPSFWQKLLFWCSV